MTKGIPRELKFWRSLAHGLQETNGGRDGLGGKRGWRARRIPLSNKMKPFPLTPRALLPQVPSSSKWFNQHHWEMHLQVRH